MVFGTPPVAMVLFIDRLRKVSRMVTLAEAFSSTGSAHTLVRAHRHH